MKTCLHFLFVCGLFKVISVNLHAQPFTLECSSYLASRSSQEFTLEEAFSFYQRAWTLLETESSLSIYSEILTVLKQSLGHESLSADQKLENLFLRGENLESLLSEIPLHRTLFEQFHERVIEVFSVSEKEALLSLIEKLVASRVKAFDEEVETQSDKRQESSKLKPYIVELNHKEPLELAMFSRDGSKLVTVLKNGIGRVWDLNSDDEGSPIGKASQGLKFRRFSPDGSKVLLVYRHKTVIWDVFLEREIVTLDKHTHKVRDAEFSPDGARVAIAVKKHVKVWDVHTGKRIAKLKGHAGITSIYFSPDGSKVAALNEDNSLVVWRSDINIEVLTLKKPGEIFTSVRFSSDGTRMITRSNDKFVKVWMFGKIDDVVLLRSYRGRPTSAEFSPDGRLVVATYGEFSKVFNVKTGELIHTLRARTVGVRFARFFPDGSHIVALSSNGAIIIWEADSGNLVLETTAKISTQALVRFSSDGSKMVTTSDRGVALILDWSLFHEEGATW